MGRHADTKPLADVWRLTRWLLGYLRPYLVLFVLAALCTWGYAWANALRAAIAGAFVEYVVVADAPAAAPAPLPLPEEAAGLKERALALFPARGDRVGWVKVLVAASVAVAVLLAATEYLKTVLTSSVALRVLLDIQHAVSRHLLSLSLRFFHRRKLGDIFSRLTSDILLTNSALMFLFGELFEDVFRIVAHAAIAIYASPVLALSAAVFAPAVAIPIQAVSRKVRRRARSRQESGAEALEVMQQMLNGIRTIKGFHREDYEVERLRRANGAFFRGNMDLARAKAGSRALLELMVNALLPAVVAAGIYLLAGGSVGMGELTVFIGSAALIYEPVKRVVKSYNNIQESLAGAERVFEILAERPEIRDAPDAVDLPQVRGHVRVRGVSFSYEGEPVLRDVSIEARPGEVVALVGPSGAGKSTLLDLVARFYDPDVGAIEIDGVDVRRLGRGSLARHVAIVGQDPFLFNESVLGNVRYGRPDATLEEVRAACAAANVLDVIEALPQGFATIVGERGATLSGGQRQRLTIARAILKDAAILLLDEATSSLDAESERAVQEALDRLMVGRTTFVVAHRFSTIAGADRIVVLDRGRIVEEGHHDELRARGGLYAKLCDLQTLQPAGA